MSLKNCFAKLNGGKPVFSDPEMSKIRMLALKSLPGNGMEKAEKIAVQKLLDEAIAEQKAISDLIVEEMGIEVPAESDVTPLEDLEKAYPAKTAEPAISEKPEKLKQAEQPVKRDNYAIALERAARNKIAEIRKTALKLDNEQAVKMLNDEADRKEAEFVEKYGKSSTEQPASGEGAQNEIDKTGGIRFSKAKAGVTPSLIIQHNLSEQNLLHAERMGGIPIPSLAITQADHPMTGFGEITLVGGVDMADPKGYAATKVFGADIYSPRYPNVKHQFTSSMKQTAEGRLKEAIAATNTRLPWDDMENGPRELERSAPMMWQFLKDRGIEPVIKYRETKPLGKSLMPFADKLSTRAEGYYDLFDMMKDTAFIDAAYQDFKDKLIAANGEDYRADAEAEISEMRDRAKETGKDYFVSGTAQEVQQFIMNRAAAGEIDKQKTGYSLEGQISDAGLRNDMERYTKEFFEDIGANERIFQGYTNSGNRKYIPHTLDNVIKLLKKELRGGENFNYGVGTIRSKFTPQFKSIKQIQDAKDRLMDKAAFEKVKGEIDKEFFALAEEFGAYHPIGNKIGFGDTMSSTLYDAATMGLPRAFRENGFEDVPPEKLTLAAEFLEKLRALPTEYFEAKILRAVDLSEFKGAVVPEDISQKALDILKKRGINNILKYKDDADRAAKIKQLATEAELMFSKATEKARNPFTLSTLTAAIDKAMGNGFAELLEATGKFKLISSADIGKYLGEGARFNISAKNNTDNWTNEEASGNAQIASDVLEWGIKELGLYPSIERASGGSVYFEVYQSEDDAGMSGKELAKIRIGDHRGIRAQDYSIRIDNGDAFAQIDEVLDGLSNKHGGDARFSVAQDQTDTPAFKKWFGDSKVVDAEGRPLVVYHGGKGGVTEFNPELAGTVQTSDWGSGVYFTPSKWQAESYKEDANKSSDEKSNKLWGDMERKAKEFGTDVMMASIDLRNGKISHEQYDTLTRLESEWRRARSDAEKSGTGETYASFLKLENPLYETYQGITDPYLAEQAKAKGHDGIIIMHEDGSIDEIVVFRSTQIKSAIGNNGQFDGSNPDIRYSKDGRILAFVRNGETFLVADNISSTDDNVKGLLGHEIGWHALQAGRTEPEFQAMLKQLELMRKAGNQKVIDAFNRVPEDTPAHLVTEEAGGYLIENHPSLSISQKIVAWFRAQIRKIGKALPVMQRMQWFRAIDKMSVEDIVYAAEQALKSAPQTLATAQDRGTFKAEMFGKSPANNYEVDNLTGDPDPSSAKEIQSAIEGGTVMSAAEYVRDNSTNPTYRMIAEKVITQMQKFERAGHTFSLHVAHEGDLVPNGLKDARGHAWKAFDSTNTEIWLQGADMTKLVGMSHETILHELIHAVTQTAYYYGKNKTIVSQDIQDAVKSLFKIQEHVADHINGRIARIGYENLDFIEHVFLSRHNAMRDPDEVLAWGLTNPSSQRYLESIPYESGTLWTKFVDTIRQLLGLPTRANTALSELLKSAETLLNANAYPLAELYQMAGTTHTHYNQTRGLMNTSQNVGQQSIPGTAQPPAQPPRQGAIPLQGGQTGNRASWDSPEPSMFDDLVRKLQDKHIDLKRVVQAIRDTGQQIAEKFNPYLQEELFHGRSSKRVHDFINTELNPLMTEMKMRGQTLAELDQFLHARHAKEANALIAERDPNMPDGGSGMTNQEVDDYFANLPDDKRKRLESTAKRVDAIIAKTREYYAAYGLVSRDTVDGWVDMFEHYVPLMREDKDGYMGIGQGFSIKGKEVKHRTGSTAKVVDILANIAMQREKAIVRGEKNRVAVALAGLAKLNPNPDFWTFDKPPTERVLNEKTGLVEERIDPTFRNKTNVVVAKIKASNGQIQERAVIFNEHNERAVKMAEAMKNLDTVQLGGLLGTSAIITRYFSAINTQYNPIFGVTNLVRDVQAMALNLTSTKLAGKQKEVLGHILSAAKGIYLDARAERAGHPATSKWAELWEELQDQGGMTGYRDMYRVSEDRAKAIEKALDPYAWQNNMLGKIFTANGSLKVPLTVAQDKAGWLFDLLSDYNLMMEGATRLAIYKTATDNGLTKQEAASLAKNTTVNFNRKGISGVQAGALYAFFNAAMQGTARISETVFDMQKGDIKTLRLSKTGQKIVAGGVLLGVVQTLALAMAGFDDDEPPEFIRERNMIIPIGWKRYVSIPMPLGFHAIPNVGRISTEFALGGFKKPADHVLRLMGVFAEAFNPMGSAGLSLQTIAPTALDPFAALEANKDWTGKPIYKEDFSSMKPSPGFTRNKDTASIWSKFIAEGINYATGGTDYTPGTFSPTADQIDYLIGQITGGVGREVSKGFQTGEALITGENLPMHKVPLAGRFYGNLEDQSSQGNRYYSNLKEINLIEMELEGRREDRLPTDEFRKENPKSQLIGRAKYADKVISKLRKQKRDLIEKGAGRDQVRQVEDRITAEMLRFNTAVDKFDARTP